MDLLKGSWDIHLHTAPSLFERKYSSKQAVEECAKAGMNGIVIKSHHGSTVGEAHVLNKIYREITVFGGLTLNYFTGGLNIFAVQAAVATGAKIIWLPTIHAQHHEDKMGQLGSFSFQKSSVGEVPAEGITILNQNGELKEEMAGILSVLHNTPVVLASGHISPREIKKLSGYIKKNNLNIKLLVSHAFFKAPELSSTDIKEMNNTGTWFEISNFSLISGQKLQIITENILKYPEAKWVMSSDSGQKDKPFSPDALMSFAQKLMELGVDKHRVEKMLKEEPRNLLEV